MPTPNVALLKQTLAHIEANPHEWNQGEYRCETGMCFAGWAAILAGGQWENADPETGDVEYLVIEPDDEIAYVFDGGIHVKWRAQRILGLTVDQRILLCAGSNTLDDLRSIVAEIIAGAGESS
jgi:hypothetical protein